MPENEEFPENLEFQKEYLQKITVLLKSFREYKMNETLYKELMDFEPDFQIYEPYSSSLGSDLIFYFQAGITQASRFHCIDFLKLVKKLYMSFTEREKIGFSEKFIKEWQHYKEDHSPYFEILHTNFKENVEKLVNKMVVEPEKMEQNEQEELRWLLLISPLSVLIELFHRAVVYPPIIPEIVKLCRSLPGMFYDRKFRIWHTEYEPDKLEPVLSVVFRRFVLLSRWKFTPNEHWENIKLLAQGFCYGIGDEAAPLMSPEMLLDVALAEIYTKNRIPTKSVEILTEIAAKCLEFPTENEHKMHFSVSIFDAEKEKLKELKDGDIYLLTPTIIDFQLKLMMEYAEKSPEIVKNVKMTMKMMGKRMEEKELEFEEDTRERLISGTLRQHPWFVEYALSTWFGALGAHKKRIPTAIFDALPNAEKPNFEEISDEEVAGNGMDYLKELLKIGLFDKNCGLELLQIAAENVDFDREMIEKSVEMAFRELGAMADMGDAKSFIFEVLEKFRDPAMDPSENEHFIDSMLQKVAPLSPSDEEPQSTQTLLKTEIIPPLEKRRNFREPWPPTEAPKFRKIGRWEMEAMVRKERELRAQIAAKRLKEHEEELRNSMNTKETVTEWLQRAQTPDFGPPTSRSPNGSVHTLDYSMERLDMSRSSDEIPINEPEDFQQNTLNYPDRVYGGFAPRGRRRF